MAAQETTTHPSPAQGRVALYARVSTINHGQDPEMQLRELREFCSRRGWQIVGEFIDQGQSGSRDRRPALDRLMDAARGRQIDVVVVWKLDRWGRSLKHVINSLSDLESLGVSFISLRDNLDLTTASGRMLMQIIGAMAEFERSLIQERVRAGLRNARAKGKRLGRPRAVVDSSRIATLRASGASWRAIADNLGVGVATCFRHAQRTEVLHAWAAPSPRPTTFSRGAGNLPLPIRAPALEFRCDRVARSGDSPLF